MDRYDVRNASNFDQWCNFCLCDQIEKIFGYVILLDIIFQIYNVPQIRLHNQNIFNPNFQKKCCPFLLLRGQHFCPPLTNIFVHNLLKHRLTSFVFHRKKIQVCTHLLLKKLLGYDPFEHCIFQFEVQDNIFVQVLYENTFWN